MVKIALVSCGTEYSGIQKEIEKAALLKLIWITLMKLMRNSVSLLKVQA